MPIKEHPWKHIPSLTSNLHTRTGEEPINLASYAVNPTAEGQNEACAEAGRKHHTAKQTRSVKPPSRKKPTPKAEPRGGRHGERDQIDK